MNQKTIFALGFFDGVHLGHQALLTACRVFADRTGCRAGAATFNAHPDTFVLGKTPALLNTGADRQQLLHAYGMDTVLELPFDQNMMQMPWRDFLEDLLQKGAAGFVCGDDFRFGYRGEGTAELLADLCREKDLYWAIVPGRLLDGIRISSTHIRELLKQGEMENAVAFLGHPHILSGSVAAGKQLGRSIGIPTANLTLPQGIICPKYGVYAAKVTVDGKEYAAVTNIGTRPTVDGQGVTVESYLLDYTGDLYGKTITVAFYAFLRPEQKFASLEELKTQIDTDVVRTRGFFGLE